MKNSKEEKEILTYTLLLHGAKKELGITANEYIVADTIYHLSNNPSSPIQGWCYASKETLAKYVDAQKRNVHKMINRLIEKGLVEKNDDTKHLKTTPKWYSSVVLVRMSRDVPDRDETSLSQGRNVPIDRDETSHNIDIYKDRIKNENSKKEFSLPSQALGEERKEKSSVKREKKEIGDFSLDPDEDTIPTRSFQKQTKGRKQIEEKENTAKFIDWFPKICGRYGVPAPYVNKTERMIVQKNIAALLKAGFSMVKIGEAAERFVEEQSKNKNPLSIRPQVATGSDAMNRWLQNQ